MIYSTNHGTPTGVGNTPLGLEDNTADGDPVACVRQDISQDVTLVYGDFHPVAPWTPQLGPATYGHDTDTVAFSPVTERWLEFTPPAGIAEPLTNLAAHLRNVNQNRPHGRTLAVILLVMLMTGVIVQQTFDRMLLSRPVAAAHPAELELRQLEASCEDNHYPPGNFRSQFDRQFLPNPRLDNTTGWLVTDTLQKTQTLSGGMQYRLDVVPEVYVACMIFAYYEQGVLTGENMSVAETESGVKLITALVPPDGELAWLRFRIQVRTTPS